MCKECGDADHFGIGFGGAKIEKAKFCSKDKPVYIISFNEHMKYVFFPNMETFVEDDLETWEGRFVEMTKDVNFQEYSPMYQPEVKTDGFIVDAGRPFMVL